MSIAVPPPARRPPIYPPRRRANSPLPSGLGQPTGGIEQAVKLRAAGLSYPALALVMAEYHGVFYSAGAWRKALRGRGVPVKRRDRAGFMASERATA